MNTATVLQFIQTTRASASIFSLSGAIESFGCLDAVAGMAMASDKNNIIIVLGNVDYINSVGFGSLIQFSDRITESNKQLFIVGLQSKVHLVFTALGAHSVLNVLPKLEDALARIR